jgi:DNA transformation protein and related proteins
MAAGSPLVDYLVDELTPLGHAQGRRMFGGHGLYVDGLIVALVIDETLYLKVDAGNRAAFEAAGMEPFVYLNKGRRVALPYWEAPAAMIEEPDQLREWTMASLAVARRAQTAKPRQKARRTSIAKNRKTKRASP